MPFDGIGFVRNDPLLKIDAVIDLLSTPDKWCKGALRSHDGRYCIRGAVRAVDAADALEPAILAGDRRSRRAAVSPYRVVQRSSLYQPMIR